MTHAKSLVFRGLRGQLWKSDVDPSGAQEAGAACQNRIQCNAGVYTERLEARGSTLDSEAYLKPGADRLPHYRAAGWPILRV